MMKYLTSILNSFCLVILLLNKVCCQPFSYPFVDNSITSTCSSTQYFNTANQRCEECIAAINGTTPGSTSLECQCTSGYRRSVSSSTDLSTFLCELCAPGEVTSSDGTGCITCDATIATETSSGECQCLSGTSALIERYDNGTLLDAVQCSPCTEPYTGPGSDTGTCVACDTCSSSLCDCADCLNDDVCLNNANAISALTTALAASQSSETYIDNRVPAAYVGCYYASPNITACQVLSNLCVLELYDTNQRACALYADVYQEKTNQPNSQLNNIDSWILNMPWIFYDSPISNNPVFTTEDILNSNEITTSFSFRGTDTVFDFVVMKYDVNGVYLGWEPATTGLLQLCPDRPSVKSAAFVFGTTYSSTCNLESATFTDTNLYPSTFYEMNLRYTDTDNNVLLFPVPVLITNLGTNSDSDTATWTFVKRFFLIDSLSQIRGAGMVQYVSDMRLQVTLQTPTGNGHIYGPYLTITYSDVDPSIASTVSTSFSVSYAMNMFNQEEGLKISLAVLGSLALLYSFMEASSWRRRQGLQYVDGSSILMFLYFALSNLANVFFIVMLGYATVTLFFYKGQGTVTLLLPDANQEDIFVIFISLAFAFKTIEILGIIIMQSIADIFLLDWERPHLRDGDAKVSIWRTYFIANEWNEIQTFRKISFNFQLFAVLLFLEVVGFKSLALENSSSALDQTTGSFTDQYIPVYNSILRFAVSSLVFIVIDVLQVIYFVGIHERFIQDKIREFVDLCSVSNVSVFILANRNYGYYIHGRSVHGKADTDMMDMNNMLRKEEENLTSARGLEAGSDQQTFAIAVPYLFRAQFDKVYQPLELVRSQPAARGGNTAQDSQANESVRAYTTMKNFLASFLDHSLRDLDFYVKEKLFLESILDMEFQDPINNAFFYNDRGNSFTNVLFYGREFALLTFDILLFNIIDYSVQNYLLAAIITFIVVRFLAILRQSFSRSNLAKKTLVDKRFLV
ncbi:unnamed protein product [Clavelina lepadiformis]|uniref:Meckelin n=1 Tax=Clavelina lepadiformis TaxID=159417 RepID=A0ABP0GI44_CLALP